MAGYLDFARAVTIRWSRPAGQPASGIEESKIFAVGGRHASIARRANRCILLADASDRREARLRNCEGVVAGAVVDNDHVQGLSVLGIDAGQGLADVRRTVMNWVDHADASGSLRGDHGSAHKCERPRVPSRA
jgi:hypothetical protein